MLMPCLVSRADNLLGHNRIVTYTPVAAAVLRAFEDLD